VDLGQCLLPALFRGYGSRVRGNAGLIRSVTIAYESLARASRIPKAGPHWQADPPCRRSAARAEVARGAGTGGEGVGRAGSRGMAPLPSVLRLRQYSILDGLGEGGADGGGNGPLLAPYHTLHLPAHDIFPPLRGVPGKGLGNALLRPIEWRPGPAGGR